MATRSKGKPSGPRFDFGYHEVESADQTGTLKELLDEIDAERGYDTETKLTIHSLKHVLPLLSRLSGSEYKSTTEQLPITTLKTIKLLYVENRRLNPKTSKTTLPNKTGSGGTLQEKGAHLLDLIEIPNIHIKPSMDSATGTTLAEDSKGREAIERICSKLALEVPRDRLELSNLFFSPTKTRTPSEGVVAYIEYTNDAIYRNLADSISSDPKVLGSAFRDLAKSIYRTPSYKIREGAQRTPLHELLYVHLQSIGFIHYVLGHREFIKTVRTKASEKRPTRKEITALFMTLSHAIGDDVTPGSQFFCPNDVCQFVDKHSKHIKSLVEKITGLPTRRQGLMEDAPRAERVLRSYAYRCFNSIDLDARVLTVHDIVAALCSFRYQQTERTSCQPKWFGQEKSEGRATKAHFDRGLKITPSNPKGYIYQGIFLIYYTRFAKYKAAFDRTTPAYNGWMEFQYARMHAYINILQLRDILRVSLAAYYFDELCIEKSQSLAKTYSSRSLM